MKYTIIYTDAEGNWKTTTCVSSHDKHVAWTDVQQYLSEGDTIHLLSPGDQIIYSENDIKVADTPM
jgi:hypothetical protein